MYGSIRMYVAGCLPARMLLIVLMWVGGGWRGMYKNKITTQHTILGWYEGVEWGVGGGKVTLKTPGVSLGRQGYGGEVHYYLYKKVHTEWG